MPRSTAKRVLLLGDARQIHLIRWERHLAERGYSMHTVSLEQPREIGGSKEQIQLPAFLPPFVRYPAAVPFLRSIIRRFQPDIVNAHFLPNYGVMATMAGFHPWVLSTWGSDIMLVPEKSPFHMQRTLRVIKSADYITSDADVMSERLISLGAERDRVVTFPFGVDLASFRATAAPDHPGPRIVTNRKLEAVYSVDTIIAAFPALLKRYGEARLTVAGDGSLRADLRSAAARVAPSGCVRFAGEVRHADMPALLHDHDIYVSMSLSDTTSVSLLEAMASGLFPVVSDIPANREWIVPGDNGLLVPVRDAAALTEALATAWRDDSLRVRARDRNEAIIRERADWKKNMGEVVDLFESILSRERA
jgi:glycosyltransferase involved in cell wall biosynthesis